MRIILASTSPRRREILDKTNLSFEIHPAEFEEDMSLNLAPFELAKHLSLGKAQSVAEKHADAIVIGADTFILFENELLGKPKTPERAFEMLSKLSGRVHSVVTGVAFVHAEHNKIISHAEETKVYFRPLTTEEINEYVATGEPLDKAGAYGIQSGGGKFVEKIEGDFFTVMGLPLESTLHLLRTEFGVDVKRID
jgi:septum formation protein